MKKVFIVIVAFYFSINFAISQEKADVLGDNLGNHIATKNLNMNNYEVDNIKFLDLKPAAGNGLRFWSSNSYSITMGVDSKYYQYGPVTDYSIKMNMSNTTGRGWTWGVYGATPIAALNKDGNFKVAGQIEATKFIGDGSMLTNLPSGGGGLVNGWYGRTAHNNGGLVGSYNNIGANSTKTNPIYVIGSSYKPGDAVLNNMYGIGYTHANSSFISSSAASWGLYVAADGNARIFLAASAGGKSYFNAGNVGIGTTNPTKHLQVYGGIIKISGNSANNENTGTDNARLVIDPGPSTAHNFIRCNNSNGTQFFVKSNGAVQIGTTAIPSGYKLSVDGDIISMGAVQIGTTAIPSGYKLSVDGDIIAEAVVVKVSNEWPDFVFNYNYKLPDIQSLENYIISNKHLPGVPSAKEVKKNGINLGDMNSILLQKVEELTLNLINQNKINKKLASEIEFLKNEIENLKKSN